MSILPVGFGSSGVDVGDIANSLRFRSSASAYLSRTFGAHTNAAKWTFSAWVKRGVLSTPQYLLYSEYSANNAFRGMIVFNADNTISAFQYDNGPYGFFVTTNAIVRDPTSHMHINCIFDSANATTADRFQIWANGVRQTFSGSPTYPSSPCNINNAGNPHAIGKHIQGNDGFFDGYLSRVCFVDGQALTPDSFGYLNTDINEWVSKSQSACKAVVDAGGTNSFMLDFDDAAGLTELGYDKSSKGNNWTCNNISLTAGTTYDHMLDVPGNSYPTLNPLIPSASSYITAANLATGTIPHQYHVVGSVVVRSGKWYWETTPTSDGSILAIGTAAHSSSQAVTPYYPGSSAGSYGYDGATGNKLNNGGSAAYGNTFNTSDVIGVALDLDNGKIWFSKNGVWQASGDPAAGTNAAFTGITASVGHSSAIGRNNATASSPQAAINHGQRPFAYTPPTGFKALCQANLSDTDTVTISGTFIGNLNADGPSVWMNGVPTTLTINGNAVTFGTHADKTAGGFKLRTASSSYNNTGSNTWTATIVSDRANLFKWNNAQGNP